MRYRFYNLKISDEAFKTGFCGYFNTSKLQEKQNLNFSFQSNLIGTKKVLILKIK